MHEHLFFAETPLRPGAEITLDAGESRHIARTLRLGVGDALALFDAQATQAKAEVTQLQRGAVTVTVGECRESPPPPAPSVRLMVPWLRESPRLDWLIEKAAELGARRLSIHGAPRGGAKRVERWRRLTIAAAKQSGQPRLMEVALADPDLPPIPPPRGLAVLLTEKQGAPPLREILAEREAEVVTLAVGPERGLSEDQERQAVAGGWCLASLGARRLRSETAALAALAVVRSSCE